MQSNLKNRIALASKEGYDLIRIEDILYCEADGNYTRLYLRGGGVTVVCKSIKHLETALENDLSIYRIHHSYLINLENLMKYFKGDGGRVKMSDGKLLNVSRVRKSGLLTRIKSREV